MTEDSHRGIFENEHQIIEDYINGTGSAPKAVSTTFIRMHPDIFIKLCQRCLLSRNCCERVHHYGITLTRNPNIEDVKQFVVKAMKMLVRKWFKEAELEWSFESYKDGKPINEHIHVYAVSKKPLHKSDTKKCYPDNRMDMQRLVGLQIPKTKNYIRKDIKCEMTKDHYLKHGLQKHHSL